MSEHECPYCGETFDSAKSVGLHKRWNHDLPWEDKENLKRLYVDEQMSINEIADKWDCGSTTIEQWLDRHDIPTRDFGGRPDDAPYKDEETLRELYSEKGLSMREIAEELDSPMTAVRYHIYEHGIEKKKHKWDDEELLRQKCEKENVFVPELAEKWGCAANTIYRRLDEFDIEKPNEAKPDTAKSVPYTTIYHREDGQNYEFLVHRFVAYAHEKLTFEQLVDAGMGYHIHHKNGIKWDNSPENLQVVSWDEHREIHESLKSSNVY